MRAKKVAVNGLWGGIYRVIVVLLGFIGRTAFIHFLSAEYLGISGLFGNILTMLSLSELGFSLTISYHLYKLLDTDDRESIVGIMNFYKNVYRIVALSVAALGLTILPFLKFIIKDTTFSLEYVSIVYIIYLAKTVLSYLFSYNFTIATADQKGYLLTKIDIVMHIIMSMTNILSLFLFRNYIIYLLGEILLGIIGNIVKSIRVRKEYPYIKGKTKIQPEMKKRILKDVKNIFVSKVSNVVVTSTDNILISALISVQTVGIYSNYSMLISYVQNFFTQFTSATQASIGNMLNSESKEYSYTILKRLTVILYFITSFCTVCLFNLLNPFISLWLGKEYLLSLPVVALCVLVFYIQIVKTPLWFSVSGVGFFSEDKNISICGAVSNLLISVLAAFIFGLSGIFLGTVVSQIIQWVMKSRLFMKKYLNRSAVEYMALCTWLLLLTAAMSAGIYWALSFVSLENPFAEFAVRVLVCALAPNVINFILFYRTEEYKYLLALFKRLLKRKVKD